MKRIIKPWTDAKGRVLSDDELRTQSKSWSSDTWKEHLTTLESKSSGQFYKPEAYDGFFAELVESIFTVVTNENNSALKKKIQLAVSDLPQRQREVLELIFWEGKSQNQIAKTWGIQQSSVFSLKERALRNLQFSLKKLQGAVNSPFMRGQENSSDLWCECIQSDIAEVMNSEINRTFSHGSHWRKNK